MSSNFLHWGGVLCLWIIYLWHRLLQIPPDTPSNQILQLSFYNNKSTIVTLTFTEIFPHYSLQQSESGEQNCFLFFYFSCFIFWCRQTQLAFDNIWCSARKITHFIQSSEFRVVFTHFHFKYMWANWYSMKNISYFSS